MSENEIGKFISNVMDILKRNGFPEKRVSLPMERLYEEAYNKGFSFNKVLEFLKEKGIDHEKTPEKIIFFQSSPPEANTPESAPEPGGNMFEDMLKNFNPEMLKGVDMGQMMEMAKNMMANLPKDQLEQMQRMASDMTPSQREELLKKFRGGGDS